MLHFGAKHLSRFSPGSCKGTQNPGVIDLLSSFGCFQTKFELPIAWEGLRPGDGKKTSRHPYKAIWEKAEVTTLSCDFEKQIPGWFAQLQY